ncbi:MAG: DUF697 domain-containing protein [Bacteroidia bacterium]|nr:DUF697 domain-containing protein [Bacteroidia bacterium]MDW8235936.1 DUF697 domain-containing protein [Bacteroidia bacterium]
MSQERTLKAEKLIREHMIAAMGAGLVPLPLADWAITSAVQLNLVRKIAELYEVSFLPGVVKSLITSLVGGAAVRGGASLVKLIPGVGWMIGGLTASVLSAATTYAVGKVFQSHFATGGTLKDFDLETARRAYEKAFQEGREIAEKAARSSSSEDPYQRLHKLHELFQVGALTQEEYEAQKRKILDQL